MATNQLSENVSVDAGAPNEAKKLLCEKRLIHFVRHAWHVVEQELEFIYGWHIEALCEHLEALLGLHPSGVEFDYLLWNQPPQTTKSKVLSVFCAPWEWGPMNRPEQRYFFSSYGSMDPPWARDAEARRKLVESKWYRSQWGDRFAVTKSTASLVTNDMGGEFRASSVGTGTGHHMSRKFFDDLHNTQKGFESAGERRKVKVWMDGTVGSRGILQNAKTAVIAQCIHGDDVYAYLAAKGNYVRGVLPMHYRIGAMDDTPLGWNDPRTETGELLWPQGMPEHKVKELELNIGPVQAPAQLEQDPRDPRMLVFKEDTIRFFEIHGYNFRVLQQSEFDHELNESIVDTVTRESPKPMVIDSRLLRSIVTIDTAGTEFDMQQEARGADPSWSVAQYWMYDPKHKLMFLRAQWRARVEWLGLREGVFEFLDRWGCRKIGIEVNSHNLGGALAAELRSRPKRDYDIKPFTPTESKLVRSTTLQTKMQLGQVFILVEPASRDAVKVRDESYKDEWLSEVTQWTASDGEQADQIDTSSWAAIDIGHHEGSAWGGVNLTGRVAETLQSTPQHHQQQQMTTRSVSRRGKLSW